MTKVGATFINSPAVINRMGRIKTQMIKRLTFQLVKEHGSELKKDFGENKQIVGRYLSQSSKKIRNSIAGYITRIMKQEKE